jgi:hypothetical protein
LIFLALASFALNLANLSAYDFTLAIAAFSYFNIYPSSDCTYNSVIADCSSFNFASFSAKAGCSAMTEYFAF